MNTYEEIYTAYEEAFEEQDDDAISFYYDQLWEAKQTANDVQDAALEYMNGSDRHV